ncbi:unnamed protein product [Arctogadus glacialis]
MPGEQESSDGRKRNATHQRHRTRLPHKAGGPGQTIIHSRTEHCYRIRLEGQHRHIIHSGTGESYSPGASSPGPPHLGPRAHHGELTRDEVRS